MSLKVAHVWDEFMTKGFIDVQPLFRSSGAPVESVTIARTLWDLGVEPGDGLFFHRKLPQEILQAGTVWMRARAYLDRRYFRGGFLRFAESKMRELGTDLVHFHFGFTAAQYPELPGNRPFVVSFYGSDVSSGIKSRYWRERYREILPRAKALIVLCEAARERLVALGCAPERIHVWNLPAGVEKYPYREQPAYAGNRPVRFLMTARFVEKKGHGLLLEALSQLGDRGTDFRVTLLGYSKGISWVRDEIQRRGLGAKVEVVDTQFRGDFVSLHNEILRTQDFFVMPSVTARNGDDEGGPALSMVVAQAAGLPVVCTAFPGSEITMADGATGFLVNDPSAKPFADAISKMIAENARWREMGLAGRELAMANFGERGQIGKLVELYESAMVR
jgi:colanic acid/amylovoran biosynthesis glycosyltransferase